MSWHHWIKEHHPEAYENYDYLLELAINAYSLKKKCQKMGHIDRAHYIIMWWYKNKHKFKTYNTTIKLGIALEIHYSTVIYYYKRRKISRIYKEETKCIKDFIEH
jgi:hypothetical protein